MVQRGKAALRETRVEGGLVRGVRGNTPRFTVFKGIPYAAPPVGKLRWKLPQPVIPWEGVRECDKFGHSAPQPPSINDRVYSYDLYPEYESGEDCLYLNVWTPAASPSEKLPVFVWIHGGAFSVGSGDYTLYDGEVYCKKGIVMVSFNYRLGALGYMAHPELSAESKDKVSGNYGLYDQIAALKWVQRNIEAFGGDPEKVTIAGQSAGAGSVLALSVSPITNGLFDKAIVQSGFILGKHFNCNPPSLEYCEEYGLKFMKEMGCKNLEELRAKPANELCTDEGMMIGRPFLPLLDNIVLKEPFFKTISEGRHKDISYMYGSTSEEFGCDPTQGRIVLDDAVIFAETQQNLGRKRVFLYSFTRRVPGGDNASAAHTAELIYEFGTLSRSMRPYNGMDYQLSLNMVEYWSNFIKFGNPNGGTMPLWKAYTIEEPGCIELNTSIEMVSLRKKD